MTNLLTRAQILESDAEYLWKLAKYGDKDATSELHRLIASRLHEAGALGPALCEIAAEMHTNAAEGRSLIAARPYNRPPQIHRSERVRGSVAIELEMWDHVERDRAGLEARLGRKLPPRPSLRAIFEHVGAQFGISGSRVKAIYHAKD